MINREIIRLKVVQITYAYYQNGSKNIDAAEKELLYSLSKAYDLYNYLLLLMVAINRIAVRKVDAATNRCKRINESEMPSRKFIENRFILQLEENEQLIKYQEEQKKNWMDDEEFVRSIYDKIVDSNIYKDYMDNAESSYEKDRELWRKIYKSFIHGSESIDSLLEEKSLYWNDDKDIVDSFVLKTIKRFEEKNGAKQLLLPEYNDPTDQVYASKLFRRTLLNADYYRKLMADNSQNWDMSRIALMDVIIMQVALAEILSFPDIPLSASFNEYIEVAKLYSTPRSGYYINGVLDSIVRGLKSENKLEKE